MAIYYGSPGLNDEIDALPKEVKANIAKLPKRLQAKAKDLYNSVRLVAIKDAHYGATPLGWCCHGSLHGNPSHDHAGVARLLIAAGAEPGSDTRDASPAVKSVLAGASSRVKR